MRYSITIVQCLASSLFSLSVVADEKVVIGSNTVEPFSTANLGEWTIGLLVILMIIGAVAWFAKRFSHLGMQQAGHLKVITGISVGSREKVLLVRAGEQHLLIGVAPGQVQTLHSFAKGEIPDTPSQVGSFKQSMRDVMAKKVEE